MTLILTAYHPHHTFAFNNFAMTANSLYRCHNFHFKFLIQKSTEKRSRAIRIKLSPGTQSGHDSNRRGASQLSPYPLPKYGCNAYAFFLRYVQVRYVHFPVLRGTSHYEGLPSLLLPSESHRLWPYSSVNGQEISRP